MILVAFLRGVNVGGHRRLRPSVLAKDLSAYDVVNVGAAGTFVVRRPRSRAIFREALLSRLPFEAEVVLCDGRDLLELEPLGAEPVPAGCIRFLSILTKPARIHPLLPSDLPPEGEWFVRVVALRKRFALGHYRRHMKTIGYLGQLDRLFGAPVTTRNWSTIATILRILKENPPRSRR